MPATTCFFRLTSSEFSDSLKKHDLRPNSGCFLLNHKLWSPCQGHQEAVWEASCQGGGLHDHLQEKTISNKNWDEFEHLQFFFTWDCFPATPSSQVATLLLMCSSVCLQNILFNSHLLWIFLIRANLRKVLISMDSSDSSRILWTPLAYCFRRFSKFSSAAFFKMKFVRS